MAAPIKDGGHGSICLFVCFKHNVLFECDFFQSLDALWINSFLIDHKKRREILIGLRVSTAGTEGRKKT